MKRQVLSSILLIGSGIIQPVLAQPGVLQHQSSAAGYTTYLQLAAGPTARPLDQAAATLRELLQLTPTDELRKVSTEEDDLGFTHERYAQYYQGVPVEYGSYLVHGRNGRIETMNGEVLPVANLAPQPTLTESAALTHAITSVGATRYRWQVPADEEWIKIHQDNPNATFYPHGELLVSAGELANARLAYKFVIYAVQPASAEYVYVDAHTGEVFNKVPVTLHANTPGSAITRYSGVQTITADNNNGQFRLRETKRGAGTACGGTNGTSIETYNMLQKTSFAQASDFLDQDNNWQEFNNLAKDNAALDAHWGAEQVYDYFQTVHCRNSFDGAGGKIKGYVHTDLRALAYQNNNDNAVWDPFLKVVIYGDGTTLFSPLTSLDIIAHEIGHGHAQTMVGFANSNDEGAALNEGLSDIWGACVEQWAAPGKKPWEIGEEISLTAPNIRNLADPLSRGFPDYYRGLYYDISKPHRSSTVLSHWFYLLSQGKTGSNSAGISFSVAGIGITKASQIIFRAERRYMQAYTDYKQIRLATLNAATDLFGPCSLEEAAVFNAWYAVGVGPALPATTFSGPAVLCDNPATFQVTGTGAAWQVSPTGLLTIVSTSGNQAVIQAVPGASGRGTITATACGSTPTSKFVDIGAPSIEDFTVDDQACNQGVIYFTPVTLNPFSGYTYQWRIIGTGASIRGGTGTSPSVTVSVGSRYNFRMGLTLINSCGDDYSESIGAVNGSCGGSAIMAYPNPANSDLTLEEAAPAGQTTAADPGALGSEFDAELCNQMGIPVRTGHSQQQHLLLDTSTLPNGLYYLRTIQENNTATQQIEVKH